MNWRETPMLRLLLSIILGIWCAALCPSLSFGLFLAGIGFTGLTWSIQRKWEYQRRWIPGIFTLIALAGIGQSLTVLHDSRAYPQHLQQSLEKGTPQALLGRTLEVEPSGKRLRATLQMESVQDSSGNFQPATGKVLVYLDPPATRRAPVTGDRIAVKGNVRSIAPPMNPDQFDYRSYLAIRDIHHQVFADSSWKVLEHRPGILSKAAGLRQKALRVLREHLPTPNEYAVGAALTMGYKSALTEEIENAYANTGAMHVLAVSGLHVGLVQFILMWLLGRVPLSSKWWSVLKTTLIIAGIWGFALLTGASPSVLRASTMFSFLAVGLALQRTTNVYNTLAASALVLLVISPKLLYHVGFQLSYLAVLGIVYFQPRIYSLWHIENRFGDYLWQLSAVSLAAQLGTLPVSLYYFHQLPLYAILSGLIVVPAAGIILSLTLLLLAFHSLPFLGALLAKALYGLIFVVNSGIFIIQRLPGGLLEGVWIGPWGVCALYAIVLGLVAAHRTRQFKWVLASLFLAVLLAGSFAWQKWQSWRQRSVVVYQVYKNTAVDAFQGPHIIQISSPALKDKQLAFAAEQHRWRRRAQVDTVFHPQQFAFYGPVGGGYGFWQLGDTRLLFLEDARQLETAGALKVDAVVLSQGPDIDLMELTQKAAPRWLIADGSNPPWKARTWSEQAKALGLTFYYTADWGAVTIGKGSIEPFLKKPAE